MAQLFLANMHSRTAASTETIHEIKAPLATFDTFDLDDEDIQSVHSLKLEAKSRELVENTKKPLDVELTKVSEKDVHENNVEKVVCEEPSTGTLNVNANTCKEQDISAPAKSVMSAQVVDSNRIEADSDSSNTINSEAETVNIAKANSASNFDVHSSENNASAEDIQIKLKQKGRKHKARASNVKYEKIENSDMSDYDANETNKSASDTGRHTAIHSTTSDSSDSEDGYVRSGFVKGKGQFNVKPVKSGKHTSHAFQWASDNMDGSTPDLTPRSSPLSFPPPLSKEDAEKESKRKAYEKRLQRLQVTTNPIERPRSTTPINIFGLEEYVHMSSPEKSPLPASFDKLKITLPMEEMSRVRSPRRHAGHKHEGGDVFSFQEDRLFTHTKSAFLLDDQIKGDSPKRVLVPPTLSPKLSPARSPRNLSGDSNRPVYFLKKGHNRGSSLDIKRDFCLPIDQGWAKFDDVKPEPDSDAPWNNTVDSFTKKDEILNKSKNTNAFASTTEDDKDRAAKTDSFEKLDQQIIYVNEKTLNTEEILTVQIEQTGDTQKCDISCNVIENPTNENRNESLHRIDDELDSLC